MAFHETCVHGKSVSIFVLQLHIAIFFSRLFTYKQVRDALFRVRDRLNIIHVGNGMYRWGWL